MPMDVLALASFFPQLTVARVRRIDGPLILEARHAAFQACCPSGHQPSLRVRSRDLPTPRDLPNSFRISFPSVPSGRPA